MTLTRRNGHLVPLGQNEALRILLARSDQEMRQNFSLAFRAKLLCSLDAHLRGGGADCVSLASLVARSISEKNKPGKCLPGFLLLC